MFFTFSFAEIGIIVNAIQSRYSSDDDEYQISIMLCQQVFEALGPDLYNSWVEEFKISD